MKTKKIFNFLLLLGFLSGCDYLDIVPDNLPTLEMAFNNKCSAERFLFTCYSFVLVCKIPMNLWSIIGMEHNGEKPCL